MKKITILFCLILSISYASDQESPFDRFFSVHPFDLQIGTHIYNYQYTNILTNEIEKGATGNIAGGIGWRYSLIRSSYFSLAPRIGLELGYFKQGNNSNTTFHMPLTLDVSVGAGSTKASDIFLGFSFGGGFAANAHSYIIVRDDIEYNVIKGYFAPVLYTNINVRIDDSTFGIKPSVSWNDDYAFLGLSLIGYLTYKE